MTKEKTPIIIAVAGGSGSGKTTVANVILDRVGKETCKITYVHISDECKIRTNKSVESLITDIIGMPVNLEMIS